MRVALCCALWRRLEIAPAWWAGVNRMREQFAAAGHTLVPYIAGSEGPHRALCEQHGGVWVQHENKPLGAKWNAVVAATTEDFIFTTGSDDWYSPALVDLYLAQLAHGYEYVGLESIYFHDLASGRTCFWRGYGKGHHRHGEPVGAGRLVARRFLTTDPWDDERNDGLDWSMTKRLGLTEGLLLPVGSGAPAVDVKTRANIWLYEHVERFGDGDGGDVMDLIPEWPMLRAARFGMPENVARAVTPGGRLKIFVARSIVEQNRKQGQDNPAIVVRYPNSQEEWVHEVQGNGWSIRSKSHGGSPRVWVETAEPVTLVRREPAA